MSLFKKLKRKFKKTDHIVPLQINPHKCVGCGACMKKCKHNAIEPLNK